MNWSFRGFSGHFVFFDHRRRRLAWRPVRQRTMEELSDSKISRFRLNVHMNIRESLMKREREKREMEGERKSKVFIP